MTPVSIAAYLALFTGLGAAFLFGNLLLGRFLRPADPHAEKLEVYECGEPTIGSSFVQFDLRFYVVALLFIIFDVEVAFFFPWATVYGKATHLMDRDLVPAAQRAAADSVNTPRSDWTAIDQAAAAAEADRLVAAKFEELGVPATGDLSLAINQASPALADNRSAIASLGERMAIVLLADIAVFFAVLMVGFFYVWRRGDLDWVRAVSQERAAAPQRGPPGEIPEEAPALSA